jgi:glutamine synthetase adenylyltransferase
MKESYLALRRRIHELALDDGGRVVPDTEFEELRAWVAGVWDEVFAGVDDSGGLLEAAEAAAARPTGPL